MLILVYTHIVVSLRDLGEEKPPTNAKEDKEKDKKLTKLYGGGYFQEFKWMPDSYFAFYEAQKKEKADSINKREVISDKNFNTAPSLPKGNSITS